ncbi:hypothetical protein Glove_382g60 [Diversispora epigaea]|uniref:Crinkler effector protein N-terminal domain-containing protein n=1 Tax=Diversispora epigaea TaxID=1348612 RepID=A0A397H497_9GLOM|nr:hypothetical protein Glove_382g60 [Diversispora epigaea]
MDTITLGCLVEGDDLFDNYFEVEINKTSTVSVLKKVIRNEKENTFATIDANQLKLWKVNVSLSVPNEKLNVLTNRDLAVIEQRLEGKKLLASKKIQEYFSEQLEEEHIHIMIACLPELHTKKRRIERIEESWESYTASDGNSVQLPPKIIHMLKNDEFVPEPRNNFVTAVQNLQASQSIILPNLGQKPKHFAEGYQGNTLFITQQMIDIWNTLSADQERSIKRVLSGPMGVGKSYISYFLASKAYAESWLMLYIADANELNKRMEERAGEVICKYFIAQNKDILTAAELGQLVQYTNRYSVEITATEEILGNLLKKVDRKTLFIVDEHGVLFENEIVPNRLQILNPLMNLPYWGEHYKGVRVIFTGTAHAKYERTHMQNGQREWWIIYVGPLQDDIFDALLQMHPILKIPSIKEKVKKVTNCVPRELIYLAEYVNKSSITSIDVNTFKQVVKGFEDQRVDKILIIAQKYYNDIPKNEKNRYYAALTSMFVPSIPPVQFEWKFLDLGLIYQYKDNVIHYHPLCRSAQKALLKMYMSFDLPENIRNHPGYIIRMSRLQR